MKASLLILILTFFAAFSQIFSMRIWEKNLKDHIKALKMKSKLKANFIHKPKKMMNKPVNLFSLSKTQDKKQLKHEEDRLKSQKSKKVKQSRNKE
jgi:hypothetical protein